MSELLGKLPVSKRPDISKPRWPQNTYQGRLRHFWTTANPMNLFHSNAEIEAAQKTVLDYRNGIVDEQMTVDELWRRKAIYDSAYHATTGKKMILIGRMSAQCPCNMIITGGLLTTYQNLPGLLFWHWFNQSFNAVVNWTNRSGDSKITMKGLLTAYVCATGGAVTAALSLNSVVKNLHPLIQRLVPFIAIAVANAINIPMMRNVELREGIDVCDKDGNKLGSSRAVAPRAISQVVISRIGMASPYMSEFYINFHDVPVGKTVLLFRFLFVITPAIAHQMMKKQWYRVSVHLFRFVLRTRTHVCPSGGCTIIRANSRYANVIMQTVLCGFVLAISTPMCCALFPQWSCIEVSKLEKDLQEKIGQKHSLVYYNKGL
ncbi:unnamed protein product [Anisakis simplex]|uniref:Sidoreflexin n=1 Tax=Anisakis simplex TaxID=6269 RepID=A0A0M3IZ56_ANISI|nr:unnamed protein product [Anisakis simplex]